MIQPKKRPDTPLAETPEPKAIDNTYVKKNDLSTSVKNLEKENIGGITYSDIKRSGLTGNKIVGTPTKKDSVEYKRGFDAQRLDVAANPKAKGRIAFNTNFQNGANEYDRRNTYIRENKKYGTKEPNQLEESKIALKKKYSANKNKK